MKLEACPFCGGAARYKEWSDAHNETRRTVYCTAPMCLAAMNLATDQTISGTWNTRVPVTAEVGEGTIDAAVEAMVKADDRQTGYERCRWMLKAALPHIAAALKAQKGVGT